MGRVACPVVPFASTHRRAMNWKTDKIDEIGKNQIWREHLVKEASCTVLNEDFRLNPHTMVAITEKPTMVNPNLPPPKKKRADEIDETQAALNAALADACLSPRSKYKEPQSRNMEYGWMSKPLVPRSSQFHFGTTHYVLTADSMIFHCQYLDFTLMY